ncbi:TetR/AcrR family transcriptional regulator [Stigmatella aurantiaca]|uniref:Transcriptional regulatory protein n=2 Tax=Stigmatella aurantiaca (strain DW4/3-1) TaxID=378806 RepID=E3FMY9_STIAD|nr:TetR/AcrR family transcriptional regulator [Stigmatella aurantiaca]ADO73104.1 Transcriptional regulatory protein [Stigmatella aurantiaca DW4/3-1]
MARTKEFDRDEALKRAMFVFWEKGYEATSTDDLLRAMGIGRQSMYDTFGDKRRIYLEALRYYQSEMGAELFENLRTAASPLAALGKVLLSIADQSPSEMARGCLSVNATAELAPSDPEVASMVKSASMLCEAAFERIVQEAKRKGEIRPSADERAAGRFLLSTIRGMRISAKAGSSPEALRDIARVALDGLKAP